MFHKLSLKLALKDITSYVMSRASFIRQLILDNFHSGNYHNCQHLIVRAHAYLSLKSITNELMGGTSMLTDNMI